MAMKSPPPLINGVSPSHQWLPSGHWPDLLAFLCERFSEVGEAAWRSRMARGLVVDEAGRAQMPDSPYRVGACIYYYRELDDEPRVPFEASVIYRDEHILVADKPHFLPVMPAGRFLHETLLVRLRAGGGLDDLVPVHRIDRETAGLVLFSCNPATRDAYTALFRERRISKGYDVLAPHAPALELPLIRRSRLVEGEPFFRTREAEGAANSETRIALLERRGPLSLYRAEPVSGRKHQIRVHFAGLGLPIVNDRYYPVWREDAPEDLERPLQLLARTLAFTDPVSGQDRRFESARRL